MGREVGCGRAGSVAKAQVLVDLMNATVNDSSNDVEVRAAQALFNNRVLVGTYYAVGLGGEDLNLAETLNRQTTLNDPVTAIEVAQAGATGTVADSLAIARLYAILFNRAPEAEGFNYWMAARNRGLSFDDCNEHDESLRLHRR